MASLHPFKRLSLFSHRPNQPTMRTLTIGDLHGTPAWKNVRPDLYDKIIFLGDYLDSFKYSDDEILGNFKEILAFKDEHPGKVVLLLGNHELSYMHSSFMCSGYRYSLAEKLERLLWKHLGLFQIAWQIGNTLWTHAGIHQEYYDRKILPETLPEDENLASTLTRLFNDAYSPLFEVGDDRGGRYRSIGGPFWIDRRKLSENPIKGYHQIVGHSRVPAITTVSPFPADPGTRVTFCDCIEYGNGELFVLEL